MSRALRKPPRCRKKLLIKNMQLIYALFAQALAVGAVAVLSQSAQSQTTLYDNTSTYSGDNFNYSTVGGTVSAGNEVVLNGTFPSYAINTFQVQYDFTGTGTAAAVVDASFYANTGTAFNGYPGPAATSLRDAGNFTLTSFTTGAGNTFTYTVPGTVVPKDFTWVVTFSGLASGQSAGCPSTARQQPAKTTMMLGLTPALDGHWCKPAAATLPWSLAPN